MNDSAAHSHLNGLRQALDELRLLNLPGAAAPLLKQARQHLEALHMPAQPADQAERLAALYRVSRTLGVSLDVDEVLTQVMDAVIELTGAERGFLMLIDPANGELSLRAARNIERETLEHKDMEISRTVVRTAIEQGHGLVASNAQTDPRFAEHQSVIMYALRSILCTPLRSRGKVSGVIYVDNRLQAGQFETDDLELLDAFATQAAIAIENANIYTQADRSLAERITELETLAQVDIQLNQNLEYERVVEITRQWALVGAAANEAWVALLDPRGETLQIAAGPGVGQQISLEADLIAPAWRSGVVQVSAPGAAPARLVAPVLNAGKPLGVIVAERPQAFSAVAAQFLERLAYRAAFAITNAQLFQAVQLANQAKSKFVSVVVHELRIPMTSIKGYTDLLRQGAVGPVNEAQKGFLEVIRNNVNRMAALVSDLSDIARIETGRLKLDLAHIALSTQVDEALRSLSPEILNKKQSLELQIPADLPMVYADPQRVVQVLTNLLSNAHKYTPEGGKLSLRASLLSAPIVPQPVVRIEISDSGIGISAEDQARLFTQFFRSEDPNVREQQGWGLGLSVARSLVELMGGKIGVQSTPGSGSTFWITLPVEAGE